MKTYIVLDESGAMHLKNERFFVIAGFVTQHLRSVTSTHKRIEAIIKVRKHIPKERMVEFKATKINDNQQALFLNSLYEIKDVIPIAIVVDKDNLTKFKATENVAYNFFVKTLLNYLFKSNINILKTSEIELRLDDRNVSVKSLKDLETFLAWEFELKELNFTVNYLNSKNNRDIQMADCVANLFWKKYNIEREKLSPKIKLITKTHISKFPVKMFNKNPSLKDKKKNIQKSIAMH